MANQLHPLSGSALSNWLKLLEANPIDPQFLGRAFRISVLSVLGARNRRSERINFGAQIAATAIEHPPIFIIGHWRSGTTYLHNLLTQDSQFGYVSCRQAWVPEQFLGQYKDTESFVGRNLPKVRPMDSVPLSIDSPQEEEYALANLCPYSFYHGWHFPKKMRDYFDQYVLFQNQSDTLKAEWKQVYSRLLQTTTLKYHGKKLVLKNPANTARIPTLLDLFPNAQFIHVYRNPLDVYVSTQHLYRKILSIHALQAYNLAEVDESILIFYEKLMQRFFQDKALIPAPNLVEIRYEDLEANPLGELERVYQTLNLPGYSTAVGKLKAYLSTQVDYSKNAYSIQPEVSEAIYSAWAFAFEQWNYPPPAPIAHTTTAHTPTDPIDPRIDQQSAYR